VKEAKKKRRKERREIGGVEEGKESDTAEKDKKEDKTK